MDTQDDDRVRTQVAPLTARSLRVPEAAASGAAAPRAPGASPSGTRPKTSRVYPRNRTSASAAATLKRSPRSDRRDRPRPRERRGLRLLLGGPAGRPRGPRHRRGHDAGDGGQGARQRPESPGRERRVPAGRDRAPPRSRRVRRRRHLELRHQSLAGQARRIPRGDPRAQARRPHRDRRRDRDPPDPARSSRPTSRRSPDA